jgi:hypothetical protein
MKRRRKIIAVAGITFAAIAAIAGSLLIWLPSQSPRKPATTEIARRMDGTSSPQISSKSDFEKYIGALWGKAPAHQGQLKSQIAPPAPKPEPSADQEVACREKLRSRGIYLIAGNPCIDIDLIIKNLAEGTYSFNKPDSAYVEEPFRVILTLTTAPDQDVSAVFLGTEGKVTTKQGQFAQHLEARLRGGIDFKVDPSGPQEQTVTSLNPVVWEWSVPPLKPGNKTIFIDVAANLILGTQQEHVQLKTLDERIEIRVSILHFILAAVTSLWGVALGIATMIIAILGVVHYSRSLRRTSEHRDGDSDEPPPVELVTHQQSHSESSATHSPGA